jgi:peptidoglycan/LPS O-acetylase OafA/YrhL
MVAGKLRELDCLRGFAASYVFLGHLIIAHLGVTQPLVRMFFQFGQEAVMIFFLLSGFVIAYSVREGMPLRSYLILRARRIYPIYLAALAIAYACASFKQGQWAAIRGHDLLGNLLMLQDLSFLKPGVWFDSYQGNLPLWSLSYEWWFYMLFIPMERCIGPRFRAPTVAAVSMGALAWYWLAPAQPALYLLYFMIWWVGVEICRAYRTQLPLARPLVVPLAMLALVTAALGARVACAPTVDHHAESYGADPFLPFRHFLAACAIIAVGLVWRRFALRGFMAIFSIFSRLAPISYALYVIHYPIIHSGMLDRIPSPLIQGMAYTIVIVAAAWLLEGPCQAAITRWTKPWLEASSVPAGAPPSLR